jgi:ubiquinone/menaquinone biosynthesis C-methylase UbiE
MTDHHHAHSEHRYPGTPERLRDPARVARMEVDRVVELCLEGIDARTALDVGTGTGLFAEAYARRGLQVTGIDVNPEMIAIARGFVPSGAFDEAPADALPFADGAFDLVFLGVVLHEVADAAQALREARRVARLRVAVLEWPYREEEAPPPLEHRLSDEAVAQAARAAGLRDLDRTELTHTVLYRFPA